MSDAPSLERLLRGAEAEPCPAVALAQDGAQVVEDSFDLACAEPNVEAEHPSMVFRVQTLSPASAKLLRCPTSMLRSDHVAIFPYQVDAQAWTTARQLVLTSDFQRTGDARSYVISLATFIEMGFETLKQSFVRLNTTGEVSYTLPLRCTVGCKALSADIRTTITKLVNASAYAGVWGVYHLDAEVVPLNVQSALWELVRLGIVAHLGEGRFQVLEDYVPQLETSIVTKGAQRVCDVRRHLALEDCSTHELLSLAQEQGFQVQPFHGKRKPAPLMLKDIQPADRVCYVNSTALDVYRGYVECLLSVDKLLERGYESLKHREKPGYYDAALGRFKPAPARLAVVDDLADFTLTSQKVLAIPGAHNVETPGVRKQLAIADRVEGTPEEDGLPDARHASDMKAYVDAKKNHHFGPFRFAYVLREVKSGRNQGRCTHQWEVTCCHHKNPDDPASTRCKKTVTFSSEADHLQQVHRLRAWCIAGRRASQRSNVEQPHLGHKGVAYEDLVAKSDEELHQLLEEGMAEESWVMNEASIQPPPVKRRRSTKAAEKARPAKAAAAKAKQVRTLSRKVSSVAASSSSSSGSSSDSSSS